MKLHLSDEQNSALDNRFSWDNALNISESKYENLLHKVRKLIIMQHGPTSCFALLNVVFSCAVGNLACKSLLGLDNVIKIQGNSAILNCQWSLTTQWSTWIFEQLFAESTFSNLIQRNSPLSTILAHLLQGRTEQLQEGVVRMLCVKSIFTKNPCRCSLDGRHLLVWWVKCSLMPTGDTGKGISINHLAGLIHSSRDAPT